MGVPVAAMKKGEMRMLSLLKKVPDGKIEEILEFLNGCRDFIARQIKDPANIFPSKTIDEEILKEFVVIYAAQVQRACDASKRNTFELIFKNSQDLFACSKCRQKYDERHHDEEEDYSAKLEADFRRNIKEYRQILVDAYVEAK